MLLLVCVYLPTFPCLPDLKAMVIFLNGSRSVKPHISKTKLHYWINCCTATNQYSHSFVIISLMGTCYACYYHFCQCFRTWIWVFGAPIESLKEQQYYPLFFVCFCCCFSDVTSLGRLTRYINLSHLFSPPNFTTLPHQLLQTVASPLPLFHMWAC